MAKGKNVHGDDESSEEKLEHYEGFGIGILETFSAIAIRSLPSCSA